MIHREKIVQVLQKDLETSFLLAEKYYAIISVINNLGLTEREIQLVAFTAIKGNITNGNVRNEFCKNYNTTGPTINNIVSKLKKLGIFVKGNEYPRKVKINPIIVLDFEKEITLHIDLIHKLEAE